MAYLDLATLLKACQAARIRFNDKQPDEEADIGLRRSSHLEPTTKEERLKAALKRKIPAKDQVRAVLFSSWINMLLLAVPVGFVVNYLHVNGIAIFIVNFIAIIPLAAMISCATEEIARRAGNTLGGLLNATFGYVSPLLICPNII
jgi:Ca2+:H+ antiporter